MHRYITWNAAMPTTSPAARVSTGTATKTMLQLATPATRQCQLIRWGYSLDGITASGQTGQVELIQTDVAATVTAHVASGLIGLDPNVPASLMSLGTAATGYSASAEGTPAATRLLDSNLVPVTAGLTEVNYDFQWMPDERPIIAVSKFLRVRATFTGTGVNMLTWIVWDE